MEEIAERFRRDLQRLLDMYKYKMSVPTIMSIVQDTCRKTLSIREHPELHQKAINYFIQSTGLSRLKNEQLAKSIVKTLATEISKQCDIAPGDEPNAFSGPNPICSQGPDGCCATYKNGWNACKSKNCQMYNGGK